MAGLKDFKKVSGADDEVAKLQERLQEFFVPLVNNPMLDGVLLKNVQLTTTATDVPHNLRREPIGWTIVRQNANATIWEQTTNLPTAFLKLQSSAAVTVSIWVF